MKTLLLGWNAVLTVVVIYLFTSTPSEVDKPAVISDTTISKIESKINLSNNVFYVNTDSLFKGFEMYDDLQEDLVAEQLRMKKRYDGRLQQLETEYNDLKERAPYMTQTQGEEAQRKLMVKQQELVKMEEDLSRSLAKKEQEMVRNIKGALTKYLADYQAEKGYQFVLGKSEIGGVLYASEELDLTNDVLRGLNEEYVQSNQAEK